MSSTADELDRYMLSLEGYLRKVDSLDNSLRQTLCKTLLPNFGSIGVLFLSNLNCPKALRGLQIVIKLFYYGIESTNYVQKVESNNSYPIVDEFINQLEDKIITRKLIVDGKNFDLPRVTFLLPKYRQSLTLILIKDCLVNLHSIESCIKRNPLTEYCCYLDSLFFSIILNFCDLLQLTNGHWFIGKIVDSFKRIVINQFHGNTNQLYPHQLHPLLPYLELLEIQLTQQSNTLPSQVDHSHQSQVGRITDKLCQQFNYLLIPGICNWNQIVALLILYPNTADFLVFHKPDWISKLKTI